MFHTNLSKKVESGKEQMFLQKAFQCEVTAESI